MKQRVKRIAGRLHRQRVLIGLQVVIISIVLMIGSTSAWFTQSDSVTNALQTRELPFRLVLQEDFTTPDDVIPGQTVKKVVDVKNTGDISGFVRVLAFVDITTPDGTPLPAVPGVTFTFDDLALTDWSSGNTNLWADGEDGYYYYLGALAPGETTTQSLFKSVTLASGLGPEYKDAIMNVEIKVDAVSTKKWGYREAWWGSVSAPTSSPQDQIDAVLAPLAK